MRDVSITQALHEGGIGPIPIGVIGSPETSHADHGFMTAHRLGEDLCKIKSFYVSLDTSNSPPWSAS